MYVEEFTAIEVSVQIYSRTGEHLLLFYLENDDSKTVYISEIKDIRITLEHANLD